MRSKFMLALALAAGLGLAAAPALAGKLLCITKKDLRGESTVAQCLAKGERFAVVDKDGLVRILTPEEVELSKAFNPNVFNKRAYGMRYHKEAK